MSSQPGAVQWANVVGFCFPLGGLIAIDMTLYPHQTGQPVKGSPVMDKGRKITIHLLHGVTHTFDEFDADEFYRWWTELSTPKHVEGVRGIIRSQ